MRGSVLISRRKAGLFNEGFTAYGHILGERVMAIRGESMSQYVAIKLVIIVTGK